ncbi:MAG: pilus assembly protein PilM [Candidatus Omnitrophica bacterium]|nr:pilus assembly protein PilM [Candidatus Omnitrophota bacterium]
MGNFLVGIDIGSNFTKVVQLEQKAKPVLVKAFMFPTPFDAQGDAFKQIAAEPFFKKIEESLPLNALRASKLCVSLPSLSMTALSVFLPSISKKELLFAAINQAKQRMIPVSGPGHIFESLFLGERTLNKVTKSEVIVIRTEEPYVQKIVDLFKGVNITPALITPTPCALPGIFSKEVWAKEENIIFADIGFDSINIFIGRDSKLAFMRSVVYGFKDIIMDISRQLGISQEVAEKAIKEQGIPQVAFDAKNKVAIAEEIMRQKYEENQVNGSTASPAVNALELRMLWQPHLDRITQELRRSLVFYKEQSEGRRIEQIYFLGGVSQIKNFIATATTQIGGQCRLVFPFTDTRISKENGTEDEIINTPIFANAASLALSLEQGKAKEQALVNFLPLELRRKEMVARRRLILMLSGVVAISICSLLLLKVFIDNMILSGKIKRDNFQLSRMKLDSGRLEDLKREEDLVSRKGSQIEGLEKDRSEFLELLKELTKLSPEEITFTSVVLSSTKIKIQAEVFADYEEGEAIIAEFQHSLGKIKRLNNIVVTPLKLEKIEALGEQTEGGQMRLTQPKARKFSVTAEVALN